ncbi:MAG: hypothetical protein AAGF11_31220 [Myxococcota bacterium]
MSNLRTGIIVTLAVCVTGLYVADRVQGHHGARAMEQQLAKLEAERGVLKTLARSLESERVKMQDYRRAVTKHATHSAPAVDRGVSRSLDMVATSPEADAPAGGAEPLPPPEPPPTMEQMSEVLQDDFEAHGDDPAWSRGAEQQVLDSFHVSVDERTSLSSVRCNGAMCRIESDHDDMASFRGFAEDTVMAPDNGLWNGAIFTAVVDGGDDGQPVTAVTFIAREGEALSGVAG